MAYTPLKASTRRGTNAATVPWSKEENDQLIFMAQRSGGSGAYTTVVGALHELQTFMTDTYANVNAYTGQNAGRLVYVSDAFGSGVPGLALFTGAAAYKAIAPSTYDVAFYRATAPDVAGETQQVIVVARDIQFPADFAGSVGYVDTNPAATYTMSIKKNGVEIGTVSISTGGTFTFATASSGAAQTMNAGDRLEFVAPSGSPLEATIAGISFTLAADIRMVGA